MIGVFDSGVGGLSVLMEIRAARPDADLLYLADRGRAPYGPRQLDEVQRFSHEITEWLISRGASTIVVACNTASAAALDDLRLAHPSIPIVGMEPAVKPAAAMTRSGVIGVFATAATFQGRLFESVLSRFGQDATVMTRACPEWVEMVEAGLVDGAAVRKTLAACMEPVLAAGADTLVLGCTHFSFLGRAIGEIAGPSVAVIDPAPAVAQQAVRVAGRTPGKGSLQMAASGDRDEFARLARDLAGLSSDMVIPYP